VHSAQTRKAGQAISSASIPSGNRPSAFVLTECPSDRPKDSSEPMWNRVRRDRRPTAEAKEIDIVLSPQVRNADRAFFPAVRAGEVEVKHADLPTIQIPKTRTLLGFCGTGDPIGPITATVASGSDSAGRTKPCRMPMARRPSRSSRSATTTDG
jgi:hypothetical protein